MKRLLVAMATFFFIVAAPQYALYGEMKEYSCCIPSEENPNITEACKTLPKWECKHRGGTVVRDCSECP